MSSFPVPSAFLSVFTIRVGRGVEGPVELTLGVVMFIRGLLRCPPSSASDPVLRPSP